MDCRLGNSKVYNGIIQLESLFVFNKLSIDYQTDIIKKSIECEDSWQLQISLTI